MEEKEIEKYIENNISRIEIISIERDLVCYWATFNASIQDNWRTLKIFVKKN